MTNEIVTLMWYKIFRWLWWCSVLPSDTLTLFQMFISLYVVSRTIRRLMIVLHVAVWSIWESQNDIVFFLFGDIKRRGRHDYFIGLKMIFW